MGKFISLPPKGLGLPKNVHVASSHLQPQNVTGSISADDIRLGEMGSLREVLKDLTMKVDILMEAIDSAHMKGPDGVCREDCWSCRVSEMIRGIRVARKLGVKE